MIMNKKDYPQDIEKKSWDKMTNFYDNVIAFTYAIGILIVACLIMMLLS